MSVENNYAMRWLGFVIGLKISLKFSNRREAKPNPIANCTRIFFPRFEQVTGYC